MLTLQLETTSTCNAKCHFCLYPEAKRWGGLMSMDLYRKIIDEAAEVPQVETIMLQGLGEPLLDSKLEDRIWYASQKNGQWNVAIFTNGVHLTPSRIHALRDAGLTHLTVSLNAVRPEQHKRIMGLKDKFDQVVANCDYAIEVLPQTEIHAVANEDFNREDIRAFYFRWGRLGMGGRGQCIYEGNWSDKEAKHPFQPNDHCFRATRHIYVLYDGKVSTCCFDPTGKMVFGDLNHQTLKEVYNGYAYQNFRQDHFDNKAALYSICATCTRI